MIQKHAPAFAVGLVAAIVVAVLVVVAISSQAPAGSEDLAPVAPASLAVTTPLPEAASPPAPATPPQPAAAPQPATPPEPSPPTVEAPANERGMLSAVAIGGTCAFSLDGVYKSTGSSLYLSLKPGAHTLTCKRAHGPQGFRMVQVEPRRTTTTAFRQ
jgi:serine/threonine-protein kinase